MASPFDEKENGQQCSIPDIYQGWFGYYCHPNAPMGGGGTGFFGQANPLDGSASYPYPHPFSPRGLLHIYPELLLANANQQPPPPLPTPSVPKPATQQPIPGAGLDAGWKKTVEDGLNNKDWDEYDALLTTEASSYNSKFSKAPPFDWLDFKAMLWVESGGPSKPAWKKRAMQIGNAGDPGIETLKNKKEGSDIIMSEQLAKDILTKINDPKINIQAGVAYLLTRMANFQTLSVDDPKDTVHEYTVVANDNPSKIAQKVHTTLNSLNALNPGLDTKKLHVGDKIKYRKASMVTKVISWREFNNDNIADRYNGGGDEKYAEKLAYVKYLFNQLKR